MIKKRYVRLAMAAVFFMITVSQAAELKVGFSADALTMDPGNHRNRETETIIRNMYDGLLTRDAAMRVVPQLLESWEAIDSRTYEARLRKGIRFHDDSPLTADDVQFTFERLIKPGAVAGRTSPRKSLLGPLKSVQVLDPYTIRFVLNKPWPQFSAMLPFQQIVSRKFVKKVGSHGLKTRENGTGPFRMTEWRKGDALIMERFENYYGGAADIPPVGTACVDRVVFKIIPNPESRVAGLLSGDVDMINDVPPHAVKIIDRTSGVKVVSVNGTRSFFLALNNQNKPFDDIRIRKAVAHAIDRTAIIQSRLQGNATPISGILSPDTFGKNRSLYEYAFDPGKTRALLAEAGYPEGIDVTLDVEAAHRGLADEIARGLVQSGIRTKVKTGESKSLRKKWQTMGKPKTGDLWLTSWGNASLDPVGIFVPTHRTNDRGNSAGYANPKLDALLDTAGTEPDQEKRAALYARAEAMINSDLPYVYLWVPKDLYGISERVTGWQPAPDGRINLHDACLK